MRVLWLPQVLQDAGLKVTMEPGFATRGREFSSSIAGVLLHHTAGPGIGNRDAPSLNTVMNGRPDLAGPLSQLVLGYSGMFYCVASGRANHAGAGIYNGITDGNGRFIGIEAENSGHEPWNAIQYRAYQMGVAAILRYLHKDASWAAGHKEYARPLGRKPDPSFDMPAFRRSIVTLIANPLPPNPPEVHPVTGIPRTDIKWTASGNGYIVLFADGGIANYGDAPSATDLSCAGAQPYPETKAIAVDFHPNGKGIAVLWDNGNVDTRNAPHLGEPKL